MESATQEQTKKVAPESSHVVHERRSNINFYPVDLSLRFLLFAASLTAVIVMVTSKQTKVLPTPFPSVFITRPAKFQYSPAFIYFVAALSVTCLYSIISFLHSLAACRKSSTGGSKLLFVYIVTDVLLLGIVASATGSAGAVAYIGLKGNSHVGWPKICFLYDSYCRHIGSSVAVSLVASVVLVLLVILSSYSLYRKSC